MPNRDLTLILRARDEMSQSLKNIDASTNRLSGSLGNLVKSGAALGAGFIGINALTGALVGAVRAGIDMNASIEKASIQFRVLLGSTDAAGARVKDLYEFAATTPFEFGEVLAASRILQTLTNGALAAGDNLRFVGDVAAALDIPFQEAAFWVGRLYSGLAAGQPVGEAMLRLQELGVISGNLRVKMDELNKETGDGRAAWELFRKEVGEKTKGATEELAQSFSGLMSTLRDTINETLGKVLRPQFEQAKIAISGFINVVSSPEGAAGIAQVAGAVGILANAVGNLGSVVGTVAGPTGAFFAGLGQRITQQSAFLLSSANAALVPGTEARAAGLSAEARELRNVEASLQNYGKTLRNVRQAHLDGSLAGKNNAEVAKQGSQEWLKNASAQDKVATATKAATSAFRDEISAIRDLLSVAQKRLSGFRGALLPGERELTEQIARVEQDVRIKRFQAMFGGGGEPVFGKVAELERWLEALRLQKEIQFDFAHQQIEFAADQREVHTFDEIMLGIQSTQAEIAVFEDTIARLDRAAKLAADGIKVGTAEILDEMQFALESIPRGEAALWADAANQAQAYFDRLNALGIWRHADNPFSTPAASNNTSNNTTIIVNAGGSGSAGDVAREIERVLASRASVQIAMG